MSFHKTGGNMLNAGSVAPINETTLGQYYERKEKAYKEKLTFEQWLSHRFPAGFENFDGNLNEYDLRVCWAAAQENV